MKFQGLLVVLVVIFLSSVVATANNGDDEYQYIQIRDSGGPEQHRLAFAGEDGMAVSWNTFGKVNNPTVYYGQSKDNLDKTVDGGKSSTYNTSSTWNNHVKIPNLQHNTTYYYRVDQDDNVYSFTTAPKTGSKHPFTFAFIADLGTMGPLGLSSKGDKDWNLKPGENNTMDALKIRADEYDFIWQDGDMGYADYWLKEKVQGYLKNVTISDGPRLYEEIMNSFYNDMQPLTANKAFMVGPGNHESNCNDGGTGPYEGTDMCVEGQTNFTGLNNHYRMPSQESKGLKNMWYSFDYGQVHFIQYNSETDFPNYPENVSDINADNLGYPNEQLDWLKNDLANVDRTKTPWVIAAGHRPWYVGAKEKDICDACQAAFEDIFYDHGVDVLLFGHVHNYQTLYPMYKNKVDTENKFNNPKYPLHILNGAAGHYDGLDDIVDKNKPAGYRLGMKLYGWSKITVHNETHLTQDFIASGNNTVMDSFTLYKNRDQIDKRSVTTNNNLIATIRL